MLKLQTKALCLIKKRKGGGLISALVFGALKWKKGLLTTVAF